MNLPRLPMNPRLTFGEPLEKVCSGGHVHPGLKELFTKAYFSAHQNENLLSEEDSDGDSDIPTSPEIWLMTILKFGQGTVAIRLALKSRLENGRWILPLQVPPSAPLWLIRHFFGRLPTPLILCCVNEVDREKFRRMWLRLSADCQIAMHRLAFKQKIHRPLQKKLALALDDMKHEACLILILLITLIRNLSYEADNGWLNSKAVAVLVEYFTPSLISRPYRPGFMTKDDKMGVAIFQYLCFNLPEVQALRKRLTCERRSTFSADSSTRLSDFGMNKKVVTHPALKRVLIDDFKEVYAKSFSPVKSYQPRVETQIKSNLLSKEIPKDLDIKINTHFPLHQAIEACSSWVSEVGKKVCDVPLDHININDGKSDQKELLEYETMSEDSAAIFTKNITEGQTIDKDINSQTDLDRSEEKDSKKSSPLKMKCQAVKLAYKLRGQWMAWKLAGMFLEGATSPICGINYSKLLHDSNV